MTVGLELTSSDHEKLLAFAGAQFPRRPNGGLYIGKAASVLYHLGVRYVREEIGTKNSGVLLEDVYGTISGEEIKRLGLRIIDGSRR